jgi:hypothetical protein
LFDTAKHPLTLNRVPSIVLSPTDLAVAPLDGLISTTNLFGAALQELELGFPAEHAPVSDRMATEAVFVLDLVGLIAAQDVIRKKHNFQQSEIAQLEP